MARACLAVLLACLLCSVNAFEEVQPTTYTQLKPVSGQWNISIEKAGGAEFVPVACDQAALSAPCNQPLLAADKGGTLKFTYRLKDADLKTIDDLAAKSLRFQACYAAPSQKDRPWRKSSDVIDKDKSCPFIVKDHPLNSNNTYTFSWPLPKNTSKATWYAQVLVQCQNGTKTSFCQFDNTVNQTFWGTNIINSTPQSLVIATAICAAIGPLFLAAFFIKDNYLNKKK